MSASVENLWDKLNALELEGRFEGSAYPQGMCGFPFRLSGQGFFPGGDGLWREDAALSAKRSGTLPLGGVAFVGNDFGTFSTYEKYRSTGFENVMTWRNLKCRIVEAGLPKESCFFMNAVPGLRLEGPAIGKRKHALSKDFLKFCADFFAFQMGVLRPELVVVMGSETKLTVKAMQPDLKDVRVLYTTHPYADLRWPLTKADAIRELSAAWNDAVGRRLV